MPTKGSSGARPFATHIEFGLRPCCEIRAGREKYLVFKSLMHFGFYLMNAALVLMGLEVLYALYQLARFVL